MVDRKVIVAIIIAGALLIGPGIVTPIEQRSLVRGYFYDVAGRPITSGALSIVNNVPGVQYMELRVAINNDGDTPMETTVIEYDTPFPGEPFSTSLSYTTPAGETTHISTATPCANNNDCHSPEQVCVATGNEARCLYQTEYFESDEIQEFFITVENRYICPSTIDGNPVEYCQSGESSVRPGQMVIEQRIGWVTYAISEGGIFIGQHGDIGYTFAPTTCSGLGGQCESSLDCCNAEGFMCDLNTNICVENNAITRGVCKDIHCGRGTFPEGDPCDREVIDVLGKDIRRHPTECQPPNTDTLRIDSIQQQWSSNCGGDPCCDRMRLDCPEQIDGFTVDFCILSAEAHRGDQRIPVCNDVWSKDIFNDINWYGWNACPGGEICLVDAHCHDWGAVAITQ